MANIPPVHVKLVPYRVGTHEGFRPVPDKLTTLGEDEFLRLMADELKMSESALRAIYDRTTEKLRELTVKQYRVNTGSFFAALTARGSVERPNESLKGRKGLISLSLQPTKALQDLYFDVEVVNDTRTVDLFIRDAVEQGHTEVNRLFTANADVVIATVNGKIDTSAADEGVTLTTLAGETVATATVVSSQSGYSIVKFPTLPEPGEYWLVYVCRDGMDASEYTPAMQKRKVVVVGE